MHTLHNPDNSRHFRNPNDIREQPSQHKTHTQAYTHKIQKKKPKTPTQTRIREKNQSFRTRARENKSFGVPPIYFPHASFSRVGSINKLSIMEPRPRKYTPAIHTHIYPRSIYCVVPCNNSK